MRDLQPNICYRSISKSNLIIECKSECMFDPDGAWSEQFVRLYAELRRIAHARLRRAQTMTLLDTGALVHELFKRYNHGEPVQFVDDAHFLAYSSTAMRNLIIDHLRENHRKLVHIHQPFDLLSTRLASDDQISVGELLDLDQAIRYLDTQQPRLAQLVEMRVFGGFSEDEIAQAQNISVRTVRRDWEKTRLLLQALFTEGTVDMSESRA